MPMIICIFYPKGASVIRMLENWMGKEKFFRGISKYLKKYKFQNAQTDDLWTELGEVSIKMLVYMYWDVDFSLSIVIPQ